MTLDVESLTLRRNGRTLLADLSFTLAPGEALVLRGPNGVGKSSLIRAVAGLLPAEAGRIRLAGLDLRQDRDAVQESIALAGHLDAVKPALTVEENLAFWAPLAGGDVAAGLDLFGLRPLAGRQAGLLSAGQKRRLGLARLAGCRRPLWLLDEPTVSLDAASSAAVAALVARHCAEGGMALLATHVDLGLPAARALALAPPGAAAGAADPFLAGPFE